VSLDRPLSGDVLRFDLNRERAAAADPAILDRSGRTARTLVKQGGLRVTVVTLAAGGEIPEHQADGPISVLVLEGSIRFWVRDEEYLLESGSLLTLSQGISHRASSERGGSFLLTVCLPEPIG
jgi:quercetin dioxygenase-like cupin family protein